MIRIFLGACFVFVLAGCASKSRDVVPSYVSPIQYGSWTCAQLSSEAYRIQNRLAYVSGIQDTHARFDSIVAVVPGSVALMHGDDGQTTDIARLKGELDAAERAYVMKACQTRRQHARFPMAK